MLDFQQARKNMVDCQVRSDGVHDINILRVMRKVPREEYTPKGCESLAYCDTNYSLTKSLKVNRDILAPSVFARMMNLVGIEAEHEVLMIGGGLGYELAVLSSLVSLLIVQENNPVLLEKLQEIAVVKGFVNVMVVENCMSKGYREEGPYDRIIINGGIDNMEKELLSQLRDGGKLVAIMGGKRSGSHVRLWQSNGYSEYGFSASADILLGFERKEKFVFED